jgi:hypothetical protein
MPTYTLAYKLFLVARGLVLDRAPIGAISFSDRAVERDIAAFCTGQRYDIVLCCFAAAFAGRLKELTKAPKLVIDFVDSVYLQRKRQLSEKPHVLRSMMQLPILRWWESRLKRLADTSIFISAIDAEASPIPPERQHTVVVIPNGVCTEDYRSDQLAPAHHLRIGFLGNMAYPPNVQAVTWLYREVFQNIRRGALTSRRG